MKAVAHTKRATMFVALVEGSVFYCYRATFQKEAKYSQKR